MIQKTFKDFLSAISLAFIAAAMISGCSSSTTTTPPPTTQSNVTPKAGSTYTYTQSQTDSSGNHVTGTDTTINASVTATGQSKFGQSSVYTISDGALTTDYTYSSSNDALTFIENSGASGILASVADSVFRRWITLSITSHASGVIVLDKDTIIINVGGLSIPAVAHVVADYIGSDSVYLAASEESLSVQHCRITATATAALSSSPLINQRDIYFAPKIGTYAKETTMTTIPSVTIAGIKGSKSGTLEVISSYTLK